MKKLLFSIFALSLVFISCNKDEKETCTTTETSLIGNYKITSGKYKQTPASAEEDYFALLPECEQDDIYSLSASGVFNYQDAGTACTGSYSGTWSVSGTTLSLDGEVATIQSFDCKNLIVYFSDNTVPGDRLTVTFVRQ